MLTKELRKRVPPLGATENDSDPIAVCRLYTPGSHWSWYVTEYDHETREAFGLVHGEYEELGLFNLDELESLRGPAGQMIQLDPNWKPRRISEVKWS